MAERKDPFPDLLASLARALELSEELVALVDANAAAQATLAAGADGGTVLKPTEH